LQEFSKRMAAAEAEGGGGARKAKPKRFAIDLRTPEQIEEDMKRGEEAEDDSEV
jgi:hypothetical protein